MGDTESPHAGLGHEPGALTLVCENCLPNLNLKRQDVIWRSGDRFYQLVRERGEDRVTVVIAKTIVPSGRGTHFWVWDEIAERTFPIRKGEPWKQLKERMPDWIIRMTL